MDQRTACHFVDVKMIFGEWDIEYHFSICFCFQMIEEAIRKFVRENLSHKYFPVIHGDTNKIQPLALAVKQHRPPWKRPFAKSEIVILAGLGRYVKDGAQKTVCESIRTNIRDEELKFDMGARCSITALNQNKLLQYPSNKSQNGSFFPQFTD